MTEESVKLTAPLASIAAHFIVGKAYVENTKTVIEIRAWEQRIMKVRDRKWKVLKSDTKDMGDCSHTEIVVDNGFLKTPSTSLKYVM